MSLRVAVCIATHNRIDDLARTLGELTKLAPAPDEILIAADGCNDGTVEFIRREFPTINVLVHDQPLGSIPSRNELAAACHSDIFLSLDDDSYPLEPDAITRLRALFATNPRLAVASFPQRTDEHPETLAATSFGEPHFVGSYANSAAAIRTAAFREVGGYTGWFFHTYEEPDFALRCVATGWEVRYETALTVRHHFTGVLRSEIRNHHRQARNELWSVLLRCPAPQFFAVAAFRALRQLGYAWHRGLPWVVREPQWWVAFLRGVPRCFAERAPLPWRTYLAWMQLIRTPVHDRAERAARFPSAR